MASFAAAALVKIQPQHGASQHSFAAEAKMLATHVYQELTELKLWRVWKFNAELKGLLAFLALFLQKEDDGPPLELNELTTTVTDSEAGLEDSQGITDEAKGIFAKATGVGKFRVYKSLEVATDFLFILESLLEWPAAGQMGCALQMAIGELIF